MSTFTVSTREYARAIVQYAADINCTHAESSYDDLRHWYHVSVECNSEQTYLLRGFVSGLEWMQLNYVPAD